MKYFSIKKDILATIAYFNLFDYPLKKDEIFLFLHDNDDFTEFEQALHLLSTESVIFKIGEFYSLHDNANLAARRISGYEKAVIMLKKAKMAANIISAFPFVKGVAVSGSLSKYFAGDKTDIDFFIITDPNRLWLARTFLHGFKKLTYLFNGQDLFCMNYFIDETEPEIMEKNIFTATEIATLMPLRGVNSFRNFFKANSWTNNFFPNKYIYQPAVKETIQSWLRWCMEKMLNNRLGDTLENYLMKLTSKRWNDKTISNKKNSKGILLSMHTGRHFSKPNPEIFQKKLLQRYDNSLKDIFQYYELSRYC